jgi:hypothetical protein
MIVGASGRVVITSSPWEPGYGGGFGFDDGSGGIVTNPFGGPSFGNITNASCYAAGIGGALVAVSTVGQTFWNALRTAAGGDFNIAELEGWTFEDIIALAGEAVAAIGLAGWTMILGAALMMCGISWEIQQCNNITP